MPHSRFDYEIYIRTTPEKLWDFLTRPELTQQYWSQTTQECRWTPGSPWQMKNPKGLVTDSGEVVECEPGKRLVLAWRHEFFPEFHAEGLTKVTYTLEPAGSAVKFNLHHEIERENSGYIACLATCWPLLLSSLKSLIETGQPLEETRYWPEM